MSEISKILSSLNNSYNKEQKEKEKDYYKVPDFCFCYGQLGDLFPKWRCTVDNPCKRRLNKEVP
jgi:hypothetical protein